MPVLRQLIPAAIKFARACGYDAVQVRSDSLVAAESTTFD
jgi:hypothetical protein